MPVSGPSPEVSAHAGLVDPEDCLQRALRGLSFLRTSCMSRACLRRSLHRFPRSDILDSSSRNSGMSPEAVAHAPARPKICRNSSLLRRVAECRLDSSDMTSSSTSILCRSAPVFGSHPASLLFHS